MSLTEDEEIIIGKLLLLEAYEYKDGIDKYFESILAGNTEFYDRVQALLYAYKHRKELEAAVGKEFIDSEMYEVGAKVLCVWKHLDKMTVEEMVHKCI